MSRVTLAALAAVAAVVAAGALLLGGRDADDAAPVVVDERNGALHGVRFGDSAAAVRARLGEPTDDHDGFFPEGADYTGPPAIPNPRADPHVRPTPLHFGETAYLVTPNQGVYSMATLEEGARTRAGVGVGDDLELVGERYDRVNCGEAVAGEAVFGGETPTYRWCRVLVGGNRVFFGGDPIESITLTRY